MPGTAPALSVVVPCYDATGTLPMLLESLYDQEGAPPTEIILVDNRSHDDLTAFARSWFAGAAAPHIVSVQVVEAFAHQGVSYACNVGAAHAAAERLVFIGADDAASATWLADAAALFEQAEVFCGSAISVSGEDFRRPLPDIRRLIEDPDAPLALRADQRLRAFPVLMGGDLGITRQLYTELGGLDQSLPFAGEDNELALRLRQRGIEVLTSPRFRIAYRQRHVPSQIRAETRRAARAHVLNAVRYSISSRSPIVGGTALLRATLRPVRSAARALAGRDRGHWEDALGHASLARGAWEGVLSYRVLGRAPEPRLGLGLDETDSPSARIR